MGGGRGHFGNRNHGSDDLYIPGDLLESLSPFQRLLMLTGQDEIRQQQQHDDDGTNLQHSVGFVGQQHGNEDDTPPAPAQEQQIPLNPSQSASSQMGRNSWRQLAVTTLSKCKVGAARRQTMTVQSNFVESTDYNG